MSNPTKKRKLSDIDFSSEGCHIAMVSKQQGGPANGEAYALVMKANNYSEEFVQKMQQIQVTMELPDFLRKFFGMYYEDSELLARMLGYVEPEEEMDEPEDWYENYIQSKLDSFVILKSLEDEDSLADALSKLSEDQYLALLTDQQKLEKAFKKRIKKNSPKATKPMDEEGSTKAVAQAEQLDDVTKSKVEPSETPDKGKQMEELVALQKALDEQAVELAKARQTLAAFEVERKENIRKARFELLKAAVKDEAKAESLFKGLSLIEDEAEYSAVLKTLAEMQSTIEKSALFQETGASVEGEVVEQESAVAKVIKQRLAKNK